MCMLRSFLLASQWAGDGGREEGKKRKMAERKMREGTGKLAGYSIQIRAGNRRDERNERKRLNRNECGYEEAQRKREGKGMLPGGSIKDHDVPRHLSAAGERCYASARHL